MKKTTFLTIATLLTLTMAVLIGCDLEDEVKDEVEDSDANDYEDSADIELDPLTVSTDNQKALESCGQTSVNIELEKAGVDLDQITINEVDLLYVKAMYSDASWLPADIATLTCSLTINGTMSATLTETAVNNGSDGTWQELSLTQEQADAVTYYLDNPDEVFNYCVSCSDEPDSGSFLYWINIGVNVQGEVDIN